MEMEEEYENEFYQEYIHSDKNESDLLSSSFDEEEFVEKEDEFKKILLIEKILEERKSSIKKILNFLSKFMKIKIFQNILQNRILLLRQVNIIRLQRCFRYFLKRNQIKEILEKEENNFTIFSSIKFVKHIDLKVYLEDDTIKLFHFDFCKLRNCFVLYILRNICKNSVFRVNFIADGKIVIDPMYKADYDLNKSGMFYNIIDFNKIEKIEKLQKEDKKRVLKFHYDNSRKKKEFSENHKRDFIFSSSESESDENSEKKRKIPLKENRKYGDFCLAMSNSLKFLTKNAAPHSALQLTNIYSTKNSYRNSFNFPSPLKSILRSPNSSRHNMSSKRVSFCEDKY